MKKKIIVGISIALILILSIIIIIILSLPDNKSDISKKSSPQSTTTETHTHIWSEWITETEATCTSKGLKYRLCECGEKDEISLAILEHQFSQWTVINEAKCGIEGLKERYCTNCSFKETQSIDAFVHTIGDWIIQNNRKEFLCIYCGETLKIENINVSEGLKIENGTVLSLGTCSDNEIVVPLTYRNIAVTTIGEQAFEYKKITGIILPDTVTTIQKNAFYQCSNLKNISFGANISIIEKKAFFKCSALEILHLPNSLTTLKEHAFACCSFLKSIYIGKSITTIEMKAFMDCKKLTSIYFDGTMAEWNAINKGEDWDLGTPQYTIYCTDGNITK